MSLTTARIQSVEMHPHQFAEPAIFLFPESGWSNFDAWYC